MDQIYNQDEVQELLNRVFKLSAKEINDKLTKVRNRPEIAKRRWFWELLQNAKDSVSKSETVDVILLISKNNDGKHFVTFKHNGNPFRYKDVNNLIFPYSDKDEEENSDKSGRFGTGFLATHFLSSKICISGVYQKDGKSFEFKFTLDRSANNKSRLAEGINRTWQEFHDNTEVNSKYKYDKSKFDTCFTYPLDEDMVQIANDSIEDFQISLPFALTFIPKINSITIENKLTDEKVKYSVSKERSKKITDSINKTVILKKGTESFPNPEVSIISCANKHLDVAFEILIENDNTVIKNLTYRQPVLFCSFPLIGANRFPFPIVVNSEGFIPKEERNGIWLEKTKAGLQNQKLFEESKTLFETLINHASLNNWKSTYNLFKTFKQEPKFPDLDSNWFKNRIQEPLKESLVSNPLIDNSKGERKTAKEIKFPDYKKSDVREQIWSQLKILDESKVTRETEIQSWYEVIWKSENQYNLKVLLKGISIKNDIDELKKDFGDSKDCSLNWLNDTVNLALRNESSLLNDDETKVLPNQFGVFKVKDDLYLDDGTIDEQLKEIFALIGDFKSGIVDLRKELLEKKIYAPLPRNKTIGIAKVGPLISDYVKELLREDNPPKELQDLFSKLWIWLTENPIERKKYFRELNTATLNYKTANEKQHKQLSELLKKDRKGNLSLDSLENLDASKIAQLNDPNFELKFQLGEKALKEELQEKKEFEFKKKTGDVFENLFHQIINSDDRFDIQKVEGEEDFIIKGRYNAEQYYIELKSIKSNVQKIQMTHKQAKKAYRYPSRYFLCFIPNNGEIIDQKYFRDNAYFDGNIGVKLTDKVNKALTFEETENGIAVEFEDDLLKQYKKYRYKFIISRDQLGQDKIDAFISRLLS